MPNPVEALGSETDIPYPQDTGRSGVRFTSAFAGTFVLIPQNAKRLTLCVSKLSGGSDCYIRPLAIPDLGGFALTTAQPNLVLDGGTVGAYLRGPWWIQTEGEVNVWLFETSED